MGFINLVSVSKLLAICFMAIALDWGVGITANGMFEFHVSKLAAGERR